MGSKIQNKNKTIYKPNKTNQKFFFCSIFFMYSPLSSPLSSLIVKKTKQKKEVGLLFSLPSLFLSFAFSLSLSLSLSIWDT
jgi:hypothetical protein